MALKGGLHRPAVHDHLKPPPLDHSASPTEAGQRYRGLEVVTANGTVDALATVVHRHLQGANAGAAEQTAFGVQQADLTGMAVFEQQAAQTIQVVCTAFGRVVLVEVCQQAVDVVLHALHGVQQLPVALFEVAQVQLQQTQHASDTNPGRQDDTTDPSQPVRGPQRGPGGCEHGAHAVNGGC